MHYCISKCCKYLYCTIFWINLLLIKSCIIVTINWSNIWIIISVLLQKATTGHAPGPEVSVNEPNKGNLGFIHAFVAALSVIIVSELGDKTFFIAAIMAMRYNRLTVLAGAMLALGLMTCLSGRLFKYTFTF